MAKWLWMTAGYLQSRGLAAIKNKGSKPGPFYPELRKRGKETQKRGREGGT